MTSTNDDGRKVEFGDVLAKLLNEKHNGYTREKLANDLGITPGMVSQYTTSKAQPTVERLAQIANLLDVSLDFLVFNFSRGEGWGQDSRTAIRYIDVAISELRTQTLQETAFVGRIAASLGRVVQEHAQKVAASVKHAAQGTILDDETLIIEQYSTRTSIVSTDLQYDILESDEFEEGVEGRFLPVVAECLQRGARYQFLLPERADRDWNEIVARYRAILKRLIGPDLITNCAFRQTKDPVFVGYGSYHLDEARLEKDEPGLYEQVREWIHDGNLAYTIGPSSQFSGDALMDRSHFVHAEKAFRAMWDRAKPVSGESTSVSRRR